MIVEMHSKPPNQEALDKAASEGRELALIVGPVKVWHAAGGLPGGLTDTVFYVYWKDLNQDSTSKA